MNKKPIFTGCACVLGLFILSSCATYERNYSGELLEKEEVAFLFRDSVDHHKLRLELIEENNPTENSPAKLNNIVQYCGIIPLEFPKPNCLEIIPGEYSVQAWATESSRDHSKRYGPYDFSFEAYPGHLYRVDAQKKYQEEKKLWFLTFKSKPYYEINIQDMTSSCQYQSFLEEVVRK